MVSLFGGGQRNSVYFLMNSSGLRGDTGGYRGIFRNSGGFEGFRGGSGMVPCFTDTPFFAQ